MEQKGVRTAVIKHAHHGIDIDVTNDSGKLFRGGIPLVLTVCDDVEIVYRRNSSPRSLNQIIAEVAPYADLIITEGYKKAGYPAVEVLRKDISTEYLNLPSIIARVADFKVDDGKGTIKVFAFEQIEELTDYLLKFFNI